MSETSVTTASAASIAASRAKAAKKHILTRDIIDKSGLCGVHIVYDDATNAIMAVSFGVSYEELKRIFAMLTDNPNETKKKKFRDALRTFFLKNKLDEDNVEEVVSYAADNKQFRIEKVLETICVKTGQKTLKRHTVTVVNGQANVGKTMSLPTKNTEFCWEMIDGKPGKFQQICRYGDFETTKEVTQLLSRPDDTQSDADSAPQK